MPATDTKNEGFEVVATIIPIYGFWNDEIETIPSGNKTIREMMFRTDKHNKHNSQAEKLRLQLTSKQLTQSKQIKNERLANCG